MSTRLQEAACRFRWLASVVLTVVIFALVIQCVPRISGAPDPNALMVQGSSTNGLPILTQQLGSASPNSLRAQRVGSQTGAATALTATLGSTVGQRTYLSGFAITASGSTAASVVQVTTTNLAVAQNYTYVFPAGVTTAAANLVVNFDPPIQANADNVGISVNLPSGGAGNTNASITAWGFSQ